tara:strand:- start:3258 stop:4082 length:825 start_codon:yes stop_codon:yes gene_type:complete
MNSIPKKMELLDKNQDDESAIKSWISKLKINNNDIFVSKSPTKIKLIIPIDKYDNSKIIGIHPFGSKQQETLCTHNKKGEEIYHMMDVGGYSNISRKHPSIKILDIPYSTFKTCCMKYPIYKDLCKRYEKVVGKTIMVKIMIHIIKDTVLYINNSVMPRLFPESHLNDEKTHIVLFNNSHLEHYFKLSYRTSGKELFPKKLGASILYSNIYPGRFGNNSININNVKEINNKGQKNVMKIIKHIKQKKKTQKKRKTQKKKKTQKKNTNRETRRHK